MFNVNIKINANDIKDLNYNNLQKGVQGGLRDTLIFMHGIGVKVTPVRTGFLRKGFEDKLSKTKANFFNNVKYAGFVNDGTRFQKANPFMENITKKTSEEVEKIFLKNFNKILG